MTDREPIRGVMTARSSDIHESITRQVEASLAVLPDDATAALLAVATEQGINLAFAVRAGRGWEIGAYVGKRGWDKPLTSGVAVRKVWRKK